MSRRKISGIGVLTVILMVLVLALSACGGRKESGGWLAAVDGEKITASEVESMVRSMEMKYRSYGVTEEEFYGDEASRKALYDGVLEALIDQKLVPVLAVRNGMLPLSEEETAEWYAQGNAELEAMREASSKNPDVSLSDMLEFFGCTEDDYVEKFVASKTYNLCYQYLSDLAEIRDEEIRAYYERLLDQQKNAGESEPKYLGSYAEEGTLLFFPEGAVYVEYLTLDQNAPDSDDFETLEAFYGEQADRTAAVAFPGSAQFSEETLGVILGLLPGETTGRIEETGKTLIFRRMDDPAVPKGWEDLPDVLMDSLKRSAGESYVEELLLQAREQGLVEYPAS